MLNYGSDGPQNLKTILGINRSLQLHAQTGDAGKVLTVIRCFSGVGRSFCGAIGFVCIFKSHLAAMTISRTKGRKLWRIVFGAVKHIKRLKN